MAGKLPNKQDKERCKRCPYSLMEIEISPDKWEGVSKDTKRIKNRRQFLWCCKYENVCCRVAWNCQEIY